MKNIVKYFLLLSAFALALTACKKEAEFEPGPVDPEDCYGVYFPSQEASGSHTYDPDMERSMSITLLRKNTTGAITVPFTAEVSHENVFEFGKIEFADGQAETTLEVKFPNAEEGVDYSFSLLLDDNNTYISHYNQGAIAFDSSVLIVSWQYVLNPVTGEPAVFEFTQTRWQEVAYAKIRYYEVNGIQTCITESTGRHIYNGSEYEAPGFWGSDGDGETELEFRVYTKDFNNDGNMFVEMFPSMVYHNSTYDADVYAFDYYYFWTIYQDSLDNHQSGLDGLSWLEFAKKYQSSYPVGYYDGNGGYFFYSRTYGMYGIGGWTWDDIDIIGIGEGFTRVDYSLSVSQNGVAEDGEVPINFQLGPDVAKAAYQFIEGDLSNIQTENALKEFEKDAKNCKDFVTESGDYSFALDATGVYTLIAAALDAEGNVQNSTSIKVTFLNPEDAEEYAVDINGGLNDTNKYVPTGVNPETSLEAYVYGSDIVDAKIGIYSYVDLMADFEACEDDLMESESADAETLEAINGKGFSSIVKGLLPGTEYYLLVYASNGYSETTEIFGPATTLGDPLPIYQTFTVNDADEDLFQDDPEYWEGKTWNYYAIDNTGDLGMREYIGKVATSINPDDAVNAKYGSSILADGLLGDGSWAAKYGYDLGTNVIELDCVDGVLYMCSTATHDGLCTIQTHALATGSWYQGVTYYCAFVPVMEGYWAMVDVAGSSYNFGGIRNINGGYLWNSYDQPLLVDPSVDDNGLAPSKAAVAKAQKHMEKAVAENANLPEAARIKAISASFNKKASIHSYGTFTKGLGACPVNAVKVKSVKYLGESSVPATRGNEAQPVKERVNVR